MKTSSYIFFSFVLLATACKPNQDQHITNALLYYPQQDSLLISSLMEESKYSIVSESEQINLDLKLLDIVSDSIISLGELSKGRNSLFFFFSKYQCGECVDRELEYLTNLYPENSVIVIGKESSKRNLIILQKTKKISQKIFLMRPTDSFGISMENLNRPLFFRINELGRPYNLYSPKFSYPQFSIQYHTTMVSQLNR